MKTAHINCPKEDIAPIVIMPGDPLRAKYIAEKFLTDARLVTEVRAMYGFTGKYKGKEVTVMGSGMGMPSIGIYSYELYQFYNVEKIIRIGTCGSYKGDFNLKELLLVDSAFSESTYAETQNGCADKVLYPSNSLNEKIKHTAENNNIRLRNGRIHSSDVFYRDTNLQDDSCLGVEMESFALFHNASVLNKEAACLLTVSDSLVTNEQLSSEEREKSLNEMITLVLESIL